jgi:hypothetical protein
MRLLQGAWVGFVLGVVGGLASFFAMLPTPSGRPAVAGEAECGTGVVGFLIFGPIIAFVLAMVGGGMGCLLGLLVGAVYDSVERARNSRSPRMTPAPCCSNCGRHATIPERNVSALCFGCGEPLSLVPLKPEEREL